MRRMIPNLICLGIAVLAVIIGILNFSLNGIMVPAAVVFLAFFIALGTNEDGKYRVPLPGRSITVCVLCLVSAAFTVACFFTSKESILYYTFYVLQYVIGGIAFTVVLAALLIRAFYHAVFDQKYEFREVWKQGKTWIILDIIFICLTVALWLLV